MKNKGTRMTLVPLNAEEIRNFGLSDVVAVFVDQKSGVINVGRPSLAPYYPAIANMFGFNSALDKDYYMVLKEEIELKDKSIYSVIVSPEQTIIDVVLVNELDNLEVEDVLAKYLQRENKMRK